MFCPNCGANNTTGQKFCRSCGLNLEKTAESLLIQIPAAQSAKLTKQEKLLDMFGKIAFGGFGIVVLLSVALFLFALFQAMIIKGGSSERIIGILIFLGIIFVILLISYSVLLQVRKSKKRQMRDEESDQLEAVKTAELLEEKPFIPISSVVEETTDSLYVEQKTKKFE